jgi:serine/threonine protein kinase
MTEYTITPVNNSTMRYLAPELVLYDEPAVTTIASDIYALGCLGLEASLHSIPPIQPQFLCAIYERKADTYFSWCFLPSHIRAAGILPKYMEILQRISLRRKASLWKNLPSTRNYSGRCSINVGLQTPKHVPQPRI